MYNNKKSAAAANRALLGAISGRWLAFVELNLKLRTTTAYLFPVGRLLSFLNAAYVIIPIKMRDKNSNEVKENIMAKPPFYRKSATALDCTCNYYTTIPLLAQGILFHGCGQPRRYKKSTTPKGNSLFFLSSLRLILYFILASPNLFLHSLNIRRWRSFRLRGRNQVWIAAFRVIYP